MKKWLSFLFLFVLSMSFASAQGLGELLDLVSESTLILSAVFIISFSILFFALNKFFKKNPAVAGAVALAISVLITYGVHKSGININIQDWFSGVGISQEVLMTVIPLLILAAVVFMVIKFGTKALIVLGALLIVIGLLVFDEVTSVIILGVVVIIAGLIISAVLKFLGISAGVGKKGKEKGKD